MNGSQGVSPAYMRNGLAFSVNSAMRWLETSGMTSGGSTASLRWLLLNGWAKAFQCRLELIYEAHLRTNAWTQIPIEAATNIAGTEDVCGDLGVDVATHVNRLMRLNAQVLQAGGLINLDPIAWNETALMVWKHANIIKILDKKTFPHQNGCIKDVIWMYKWKSLGYGSESKTTFVRPFCLRAKTKTWLLPKLLEPSCARMLSSAVGDYKQNFSKSAVKPWWWNIRSKSNAIKCSLGKSKEWVFGGAWFANHPTQEKRAWLRIRVLRRWWLGSWVYFRGV